MAAEENKAVIYRFIHEGLNQRRQDLIDEVFSPDYVGHDPDLSMARRITDLKRSIEELLGWVFPDAHYSIESLMAEEDMVVWHWTLNATHLGDLMDISATGRAVRLCGVHIFRMANAKVMEDWVYCDSAGLLRQLGVLPYRPEI